MTEIQTLLGEENMRRVQQKSNTFRIHSLRRGLGLLCVSSSYMDDITGGCVGCHAMFRGVPGQSSLLR
ncbi:hypothetical protein DJ030_06065 [bacterium endosymbiont of Escarpia laminata]|nr:MAG: hypothetical protein DJ031_16805 [bacterium endosymbiont of Escarpia laminata]RLJ20708.1 MAG: hypothetical protein DJ030_06065 [bacterium endosymbiont of Escarpia laminata]